MSLIDDFGYNCVLLVPERRPDGEGGFETHWTEKDTFDAAITCAESAEARRAEQDGVRGRYTVTVDRGLMLRYHDVFRRLSDNKLFRVTSNGDDVQTPARASFSFAQVTAEEWRLPE